MKVLVVGLYNEPSGYGHAAQETILALDAAGVDVVCRPLQLQPGRQTHHERIRELESRTLSGPCDALVVHAPPYYYQTLHEAGLNVGLFYAETDPVPPSWTARANLMDVVVSPCQDMTDVLGRSPGFIRPIETIGISCDPTKYQKTYSTPSVLEKFKRNRFLFYTVGEWVRRKNTLGLVKAYFAEFASYERVGLVIKTSQGSQDAQEVSRGVIEEIASVQKAMKLTRTPDVLVVTDRLTEDELYGLHQAGDVFVQPSFTESWGIPAFDALGFGKTPIVTDAGGFRSYVDNESGWLIPARPEPVFGEGPVHAELFTGKQSWWAPDPVALRRMMRQAFEDAALRERKAAQAAGTIDRFSRVAIGNQLLKVLEKHGQAFASRRSPRVR